MSLESKSFQYTKQRYFVINKKSTFQSSDVLSSMYKMSALKWYFMFYIFHAISEIAINKPLDWIFNEKLICNNNNNNYSFERLKHVSNSALHSWVANKHSSFARTKHSLMCIIESLLSTTFIIQTKNKQFKEEEEKMISLSHKNSRPLSICQSLLFKPSNFCCLRK